MKRLTCYIVLLHGLVLGVSNTMALSAGKAVAKTVVAAVGKDKGVKKTLKPGQVWVLGKNQQVQPENFAWVVEDIKKASQQPFLQLAKKPEDSKKPNEKNKPPKRDDLEPFDEVTKDTQRLDGLFTLYRNKEKNKIYLEIKPEQLNKNFLTTATLESGIGEGGIYSGMPLQDFLFYFQRVNNNLQFVVRNVNFRTRDGDPQARSLARSFSDSVLYNIPIKSINSDRKTLLIDLGDLLLTDLAGLSASLGVSSGAEGSYFGSAKTFPQNIEIESVMNVIGGGSGRSKETGLPNFEALADNRGFTLRIHYSLSQLADNNYRPRLADERVGYFITAYQDLSNDERRDPFVRYTNRWNLEKKDPNAAISPPKKPIVFWIDNAVPFEYRDAIKEGVLMWNQAFAKIGFKDAIQVQQMPEKAAWDPADIRYNTIRWINTVDGFFAMGPSRVNPLTGEILDADILVDASFVRALKNDYRQIVQPNQTQNRTTISALMQNRLLCANGLDAKVFSKGKQQQNQTGFIAQISRLAGEYDLCYGIEAANQFAVGKMTMTMLPTVAATPEQIKTYIHQYLRLIIAHEVGHTLGLRHNFRGSTMLKPEEMNNTEITRRRGLTTSLMDYIPPNIAPKGIKQGDYFPSMVGPYDDWAIKYGYAPIQVATTAAEKPFLEKIAQESVANPELSYSTDEDMFDLDPTVNAWDNSRNVLTYSQWQLDNSRQLWDLINKRYPTNDDGISDVGEQFGTVLGNYFQNIFFATKYIGGQSFYRVRSSDRNGRLPFEPVAVEKQREALATLQKYVFADDAFNFPPELLNKLAPSRWRHWGSNPQIGRLDYPIHDLVLFIQSSVLVDLLSGDRLSRIKDIELKTDSGNSLTIPELFDTLQSGIWTEVIKPKRGDIKISSLRRGIQRRYLDVLTGMVLRKGEDFSSVPEDARTIAWYKLKQLDEKLKSVNSDDEYTKAHILETRDRIDKILDARIQSN
ncbi:MAG: zinc-dependent metalloprotease [Methylacidiphilales bacterium]|nr:zinc-dependent metalloprotease [Candidatus Methylacidiphilales bacterium]